MEPDPRRYDDFAVETGKSYRYQMRANYYPSDACARQRDIELGINDNSVLSIWSNGEIIWLAAGWDNNKLLAYDLETGDRRAGDDITLRSGQSGEHDEGVTGHGEYVLKGSDSPLNFSAYLISDGSYDSTKSFDFTGNMRPSTADATDPDDPYYGTAYDGALTGIWRSLEADATTVWAGQLGRQVFFAYKRSDGTRDPGRDIIIPDGHPVGNQPEGLWLDEAANVAYFKHVNDDTRVYAVNLDNGRADDTLTVNLNSWQNTRGGFWSDGDIIWVSHNNTTTNRDQLIGYPLLPGRQHTNWAASAAATAVGEYGELLVKNTAQPDLGSSYSLNSQGMKRAQKFNAGSDSQVYRPTGIGVRFNRIDEPAPETKLTATINEEDAGGNPGSVRCTLTHPGAYLADAVNYYGVPDGCVLLGGESYFVVLERTDATGGSITLHAKDAASGSVNKDPGSARDWSFFDGRLYISAGDWTTHPVAQAHQLEVRGVPLGERTLVKNTARGALDFQGTLNSAGSRRAQAFTTGDDPGGYELGSVGVRFGDVAQPDDVDADIHVQLWSESGDDPGSAVCTLNRPDRIEPDGVSIFPQSGHCPDLAPDTTYFVVVSRTAHAEGDLGLSTNHQKHEDVAAPGWSIGDERHQDTPWGSNSGQVYMIEVHGVAKGAELINHDATGAPAITGTPRVDRTLTANTAGIGDANGLTNPTFAYQWIRVDSSNIPTNIGADASTYTVVADDVGNTIKVKVTFDDNYGFQETLESAATATVAEADAAVVLVKNTGQSVAASSVSLGGNNPKRAQAFTTGANAAGYTLDSIGFRFGPIADITTVGSEVTATLNGTTTDSSNNVIPGDALCTLTGPASFSANSVNAFTAPTTGTNLCPTLEAGTTYSFVVERGSGTSNIGITPTASGAEDADSLDDWSIADERLYEDSGTWNRNASQVHPIEVKGFVNSNAATGAPSIQGILETGETLTADTVGIGDPNGLTSPTYTYQWISVDSSDVETPISGATGSTYDLTSSEEGHGIRLKVSFTDDGGTTETLTSARTENVVASGATTKLLWLATLTVGTGSGSKVGFIKATQGELDPDAFTFGEEPLSIIGLSYLGTNVAFSLSGPFGSGTFILDLVDDTATLSNRGATTYHSFLSTSLSWRDGQEVTVALKQKVNRPATGAPSIQGILQVGETLTADLAGISDPNGLDSATYAYQWISVLGMTGTPIAGATNSTYTLTSAEAGAKIKLQVTVTDDGGTTEAPLTSAETDAVVLTGASRRLLWLATMEVEETIHGFGFIKLGNRGKLAPESFQYNSIEKKIIAIDYRPTLQQLLLIIRPEATSSDINLHKQWKLSLYGHEISLAEVTNLAGAFRIADSQLPAAVPNWSGGETLTVSLSEGVNVAATGAPDITGTAQVNQTLSAGISGISDANGVAGVSFTYQWKTVDGMVEADVGTDSSSYAVAAADLGKKLKVVVTFTDDDGFEETVESVLTDAVIAAATVTTPSVSIAAGTSAITEGTDATFTLTRSGTPTADLTVNVSVTESGSYISGTPDSTVTFSGTNTTFTLTVTTDPDSTHEAHGSIRAEVTSGTGYTVGLSGHASVIVLDDDNSPATGDPTISGTTREGQTLTASTSGISDGDGLAILAFTYSWQRYDSNGNATSVGANSSTYTLVAADVGHTIALTVSFLDNEGHTESRPSAATAVVVAAEPTDTLLVKNTGKAKSSFNSTLDTLNQKRAQSFETGANAGGYSVSFISVRFHSVGKPTDADDQVTATLNSESGGNPGAALCTLTNPAGIVEDDVSHFAAPASCPDLDASTTYFVVLERTTADAANSIGLNVTTDKGEDTGGLSGWSIGDDRHGSTGTWGSSSADVFMVRVWGAQLTLTNSPATGAPTISGTPQVGQTLTAGTSGISDADGLATPGYTYQWIRNDGSSDSDIDGATNSTYTLVTDDAGHTIKVRVSFTDDASNDEGPLTSPPTAAVHDPTLLVKNTLQSEGGHAVLSSTHTAFGQAFTTGSNPGGYALSSIGLRLGGSPGGTLTLNSVASDSAPGSALCTLTAPGSFTANSLNTFTAPSTCPALTASTTYFAVLTRSGSTNSQAAYTVSGTEDPGTAADWSLADAGYFYDDGSSAWNVYVSPNTVFQIVVRGSEKAGTTLPAVNIAAGTSPVTEGTDATFTLTRSGTPTGDLMVNVGVTQSGDYIKVPAPATVTFTGTETTAVLTVETDNDDANETQGSITATVDQSQPVMPADSRFSSATTACAWETGVSPAGRTCTRPWATGSVRVQSPPGGSWARARLTAMGWPSFMRCLAGSMTALAAAMMWPVDR